MIGEYYLIIAVFAGASMWVQYKTTKNNIHGKL